VSEVKGTTDGLPIGQLLCDLGMIQNHLERVWRAYTAWLDINAGRTVVGDDEFDKVAYKLSHAAFLVAQADDTLCALFHTRGEAA